MIDLLIGTLVSAIILLITYFLGGTHGIRGGADRRKSTHGSTPSISTRRARADDGGLAMYHGSSSEIGVLEPQMSKLTPAPVVFGTPSYTDAVIFSAQWTDYDFAMWGDGKKRYLEEQYPGAFAKLNRIGYIHHLREGVNGAPFKPLGSGLSSEYVCTEAVKPFRVDKVNVREYLLGLVGRTSGSPSAASVKTKLVSPGTVDGPPLVMRTHAEAVAARVSAEVIVVKGNILCHVVPADLADTSVAELCAKHSIRVWRINRDNIDDADLSEPCVMIGNPLSGNARYEFSCPRVYLRSDFGALIAGFAHRKTTTGEYSQYLHATRDLYHSYTWMDLKQLDAYLPLLVLQMQIRLTSPPITHIVGPAGSGKSSLAKKLTSLGIRAVDIDDIDVNGNVGVNPEVRNDMGTNSPHGFYSAISRQIANGERVFLGIQDMSVLATRKYLLDVDPVVVYKQLVGRTIDSICENAGAIKRELSGTTIEALEREHDVVVNKYHIRFPGPGVPPGEYVHNEYNPRRNRAVNEQYVPLSAERIVEMLARSGK